MKLYSDRGICCGDFLFGLTNSHCEDVTWSGGNLVWASFFAFFAKLSWIVVCSDSKRCIDTRNARGACGVCGLRGVHVIHVVVSRDFCSAHVVSVYVASSRRLLWIPLQLGAPVFE
ncbi:hypothetical protein Taro_051456 [Colocasia esculenta]|uniref:Uncharacterized protein n=1 Tax=Colocasia esculenta TaxID=4460 RepID=A0A843XG14_COLES|nr:hypothetical protein [Colocasia esculenta]